MNSGPDLSTIRGTKWHALSPEEVLKKLQTKTEGLSADEHRRRQENYGPNRLPEPEKAGLIKIVFRQFVDPLIFILLIAALVSLATGYLNNAIFITAVLVINTAIGTWQEYQAEQSANALESTIRIAVNLRIGDETREVDAEELVPGDVFKVTDGVSVPADARLLESTELRTDESLLTGESTPISKDAHAELEKEMPLGDRSTLLHAGSMIMSGRAVAVVCRTAEQTEIGRIAASLAESGSQEPPLVIRLRLFTRMVGVATLGAIAILAVIQRLRGDPWADIFFLGVALAVSAIPAGLPVAITVALSIASKRMAERRVVVRMLTAVEGLGACTCIASDKTGTLTANQLTVQCLDFLDATRVEISGRGLELSGETRCDNASCNEEQQEKIKKLASASLLCNEASLLENESDQAEIEIKGDTVDAAFLILGRKLGLDQRELEQKYQRINILPFASEHRYAATFDRIDGRTVAHVKGAAEVVAQMCEVDAEEVAAREDELAMNGFRVLAVASGDVAEESARDGDRSGLQDLRFLGLAGLIDPIREAVSDAVARCQQAGITVRMVTGDHPATGLAIARKVGIAGDDDLALTGQELAKLSREQQQEKIRATKVYARVEPTQKTSIIETLQELGDFVAVTGDGVNDAPALQKAHIGVAMGKGGTDVARNSADLILTDDNFASIVNGIEEGRIAYSNVRKVVWLLISTAAAEVLLFFLAVGFGYPIPLLPVQLLWLNLVTNGIQDVALAFERGTPEILSNPPRPPDEPIFNRRMLQQVISSGVYIGTMSFLGFHYWYEMQGYPIETARNLTLLLVVLFENIHIFSCRSEERSTFKISLFSNPLLIGAVLLAQGVHVAVLFTPWISDILQVGPVSPQTWAILLLLAFSLLLFDEALKWLHRRSSSSDC